MYWHHLGPLIWVSFLLFLILVQSHLWSSPNLQRVSLLRGPAVEAMANLDFFEASNIQGRPGGSVFLNPKDDPSLEEPKSPEQPTISEYVEPGRDDLEANIEDEKAADPNPVSGSEHEGSIKILVSVPHHCLKSVSLLRSLQFHLTLLPGNSERGFKRGAPRR